MRPKLMSQPVFGSTESQHSAAQFFSFLFNHDAYHCNHSSFLSSDFSTRVDSLGNDMVCLGLDFRAQVT